MFATKMGTVLAASFAARATGVPVTTSNHPSARTTTSTTSQPYTSTELGRGLDRICACGIVSSMHAHRAARPWVVDRER